MKQSQTCPKCQSTDVIESRPIDLGDYNAQATLHIATYEKPDAMIFKGKKSSELTAWVCKSCGFVEWYAKEPRKL